VTDRGDREGNTTKEVAVPPIQTIAPLALGLVALAVAGCQSRPDQTTTAVPTPTRLERAAPTTTAPARQTRPPRQPPASTAPKPKPVPGPETIVGLWPVRTLDQARTIQDGADAGHQPWLLSPELVSTSYAAAELDLFDPVARQVRPAAYEVGPPELRVGGHPAPGPAGPQGRRRRLGDHPDRQPRGELPGVDFPEDGSIEP
jgi:hypothetical protein